ncbi:zinc finger protein [Penicillium angulare]|uniref:Zinc finger protein n=1 Tax=Penicillium angulare TaxID=116970 RepID=A0A9W9FZ30_9EURO|nr:zinc finger protein [Penicillium angulare]
MYRCHSCDFYCYQWTDFVIHLDYNDHWISCETCEFKSSTISACTEHMREQNHWLEKHHCETCNRFFQTKRACVQHMDALGHWALAYHCETCYKHFRTQSAAYEHMATHKHWRQLIPCETCNLFFYDEASLHRHMTKENHYARYCVLCDRFFVNPTGLRTHLNSRIHRGKDVHCPICNASFTTASSATNHIESGDCCKAPNINHESLFQAIRASDVQGWVTNTPVKIEGQNVKREKADSSPTDHAWECHICHVYFEAFKSLEQHLDSPAHRQRYYHCPNTLCERPFTRLSGLFAHLESGSCAFMRIENVLDMHRALNNVAIGHKLLTRI